MKKALVFVLILGFIGTLAFAQSITWNGYANFGTTLTSQGGTSTLLNLGSDSWVPGGRLQLEGHYAASNWGWAIRFREDTFPAGTGIYLKRAYGWVDILNNMVTLQAGKLGDYSWSTNGWQSFGNFDGVNGIQVQLKPVDGANLGVFLPTSGPGNNVVTQTAQNAFQSLVIGGEYTMKGTGYVGAGYDLGNKYLWFGGAYQGMQNLTAVIEAKYSNTATTADNYFYTDQNLGYNMAPYNFNLWAEEQFNSDSSSGTSTVFHVQPSVDYTMGSWDFGAFFTYISDTLNSGYGPGVWAKATVAKGATVALGGEYDLGNAAPATLTQNMNTFVDGVYDPLGGPFVNAGVTSALPTQANPLLRAYLDFVWSF